MRLWACVLFLSLCRPSSVVVQGFAPTLSCCEKLRHHHDNARLRRSELCATKRRGAADRNKKRSSGFGRSERKASVATYTDKNIYSFPALYDLAFGYRNYEEEVDFLLHAHIALTNEPPSRILELAAGPARHSLTALSIGNSPVKSVTAIDTSNEMKDYALQLAQNEYQVDDGAFTYICQDMRQFAVNGFNFDSAWILLGSLQHLQTNADVIKCLSTIHANLQPEGTLLLELPHPRETFSMAECTKNGWEVPLQDEVGNDSGELKIIWGDETDTFDPISQVRQFTVSFDLTGALPDDKLQSVRQVVPMRLFTAQEIDALARCSGFQVVSMYGALANDVDVNNEDEAFRLVCVLQKES